MVEPVHVPGTPVVFTIGGIRWEWSCRCGASSEGENFAKESDALRAGRGHFG